MDRVDVDSFLTDMNQPGNPTEPVFSDQVLVNDIVTRLTLTLDGELRWTDNDQRRLSLEKQVLGFVIEGDKIRVKAMVDNGLGICGFSDAGARVREDFIFQPLHDDYKTLWCQHLRNYLDSLGRPKRLFVLVNPYGGKKSASKIFLDVVKPLFDAAEVQITVQETKYQLHAKEVANSLDLTKYDGIVCVSGDGILVEVVNGLLGREDWSTAIKIPIGMIPGGTENGMVKSTLASVGEPCTAPNAVFAIIRGHKCSLDVATIVQGETKFFSVLMLAWGLIADIDIESEKYRWMGSARIDFYALQRVINLRKYNGRISFVPAPGFESYGHPTSYSGQSDGEQGTCNPSQEHPVHIQHGYPGADVDLKNLSWRTFSGPFVSIWLHNVPWGGERTMAAPDAKFSDGCLDLIVIKQCTKLSLMSLLTKVSNGGHIKSPDVLYLKVKAFILDPGQRTNEPAKGGIIDVDGEVLARGRGTYMCDKKSLMNYSKLEITVDHGLATLFCPQA